MVHLSSEEESEDPSPDQAEASEEWDDDPSPDQDATRWT